ncbi:lipid-A-disaccharide synthase N-terminal domain-containing protein [Chryseolinea sp. T2]|uniref:lipid-A-disaccharide synthase N-terminal domain-containing protein n=1 Tax=Chryseolinea sp. T2 TaxID=3129255 RepID=UPI003077D754
MNASASAIWVYGIGFVAQALFGLRIVIQWWQTERKGAVVSPIYFWYASLAGSTLFMIYGLLRHDPIIVVAQVLSYFIYIRNLQLKHVWMTVPVSLRAVIWCLPVGIGGLLLHSSAAGEVDAAFSGTSDWVVLAGGSGQFFLSFRFVVQLYYSEKRKVSLLPREFWIISLAGSLLVIIYAWFRSDVVLLLVQFASMFVYARNIVRLRSATVKS